MGEPKLHEVLAVEKDARGQAHTILAETKKVFAHPDLFKGQTLKYVPFSEDDAQLAESQEEKVGTTVQERLAWTAKHVGRYWDVVYQKEVANQQAKADIVLSDGTKVAEQVPAGMLLGLETKLKELRDSVSAMPTLDAKTQWEPRPDLGVGIWATRDEEVRIRTQKVQKPLVMYEATDKHPAQVQMVTEDVKVGKVLGRKFSGAVTSARAAEILGRVDELLRAVKRARQRANTQPVTKDKIASKLFDFMFGE